MNSDDQRNDFFGHNDFDDDEPVLGDDEAVEVASDEAILKKALEKGEKSLRKRVVQNPQPKLNENTLTGPKGIKALLETFKNYKPDKKEDPYYNLDIMMKKYENWSHVMFPRLKFDDVIARCEKLGSKARVKNYMSRVRMDMPLGEDDEEEFKSRNKGDTIVTTGNNQESDVEDHDDDYIPSKKKTSSQQLTSTTIGVITSRSDSEDGFDEPLITSKRNKTSPSLFPTDDPFSGNMDDDEEARRQFELEADAMMDNFEY